MHKRPGGTGRYEVKEFEENIAAFALRSLDAELLRVSDRRGVCQSSRRNVERARSDG